MCTRGVSGLIMKITYRISETDYLKAHNLFVANEKWYRRWSRRMLPWEGTVFVATGITSLFLTHDRLVPGFLCLMGPYCIFCGFALRKHFRKRYRTDQRFKYDFTAHISEEGIHLVTPFEESQTKWSSIVRYLESKKIFMLFHAALIFTIIPKRAFASGETDTFRELLHRNTRALLKIT
jgi:hypothetical protein